MSTLFPVNRFLLVLTAVAVLLALCGTEARQSPRVPLQSQAPRFRVGVDLVRLSVTARDAGGALIHDLAPEEFRIFEDGVEQKLAHFGHHESPISVVVLFDKSGSMTGEKLMHAKDAVVNFVGALGQEDEVLLMAFSASIDVLGNFGLDPRTIERGTKSIHTESTTRLYDAVFEAARAIATPQRKEKRAILILSDGDDTASVARLDEAAEAIKAAEVPVYAVGIEMGDDPPGWWRRDPLWARLRGSSAIDALKRLTDGTGGWTYPVEASRRCKEVCLRVAEELRHQYLLGYYPANQASDGNWRTVTVRTTRAGVTLATKSGYYGPSS